MLANHHLTFCTQAKQLPLEKVLAIEIVRKTERTDRQRQTERHLRKRGHSRNHTLLLIGQLHDQKR